ncbi:MAG: OmpA family protein [Acidimicrobiales bacterium]
MPSIIEAVSDVLDTNSGWAVLGQLIGGSGDDAKAGVAVAAPALLGALADRSDDPEGRAAVVAQLDEVDPALVADPDLALDGTDRYGRAVLDLLFGPDRGPIREALAEGGSLGAPALAMLLPRLASLVMAVVARRRADDGLDADGVATLLTDERTALDDAGSIGTWLVGLVAGGSATAVAASAAAGPSSGLPAGEEAVEAEADQVDADLEAAAVDVSTDGPDAETGDTAEGSSDGGTGAGPAVAVSAVAGTAVGVAALAGMTDAEDAVEDAADEVDADLAAAAADAGGDAAKAGTGTAGKRGAEPAAGADDAGDASAGEDATDATEVDGEPAGSSSDAGAGVGAAAAGAAAGRAGAAATDEADDRQGVRHLWWVLGGAALVTLLALALGQFGTSSSSDFGRSSSVTTAARSDPAGGDLQTRVAAQLPDGVTAVIEGDAVTLAGSLPTRDEADRLEAALLGLDGVGSVNNLIEVGDTAAGGSDDAGATVDPDLQARVDAVLPDGVTANLDGDEVTLTGTIGSTGAAAAVEQAVAGLDGVGSVRSELTVADTAATTEAPAAAAPSTEAPSSGAPSSGAAGPGTPTATPPVGTNLNDLLGLQTVTFNYLSAQLTPPGQAVLDRVVAYLATNDVTVEIQGHTDSDGPEDKNQQLSERRAVSVRDYLVSRGIAAERLTTVGLGETRPTVPNDSVANKALNRRIDFVVTS